MDWSLEDLFAEPPPKITEDCEMDGKNFAKKTFADENSFENNNKDNFGKPEDAESSHCRSIMMLKSQQGAEISEESCNRLSIGLGAGQKIPNVKDGKSEQKNTSEAKKSLNDAKRYHVPNLEEILKASTPVDNQKMGSGCMDNIRSCSSEGKFEITAEKQCDFSNNGEKNVKGIKEMFKDQFKKKEPQTFEKNTEIREKMFKRKSEEVTIANANEKLVNDAGKLVQNIGEPPSKRRKAGNYRRKLHTKCRISAKEIRKLTNETGKEEDDFFGKIPERPVNLESSPIMASKNSGIFHNPGAVEATNKFFTEFKGIESKVKAGKQKSEKSRKYRKRKIKREKLNKMQGKIDFKDDDDIVLLPRNNLQPHKWPVRKQTCKSEINKESYKNVESFEKQGERKPESGSSEINKKIKVNQTEKIGIQNSVLDSILLQVSSSDGIKIHKSLIASRGNLQKFSICTKNMRHDNVKEISHFENVPSQLTWQSMKTDNVVVSGELTKGQINDPNAGSLCRDAYANLGDAMTKDKITEWFEDIEKIDYKSNVDDANNGYSLFESGKGDKVICNKKVDDNKKLNIDEMKNDDDDENNDDDGDNDDDDDDVRANNHDDDNDHKIRSQSSSTIFELSGTLKHQNKNVDGKSDAKVQYQKTQFQAHKSVEKSNGSLLYTVDAIPVDLSIAGKEEKQQPSAGRQRRGGRKRKGKKKTKNNHQKERKIRIETETKAKVQCKYFLDGKCSKGAECRFLHEGIPRRRELCRYYVTDSCLADNCIFMHSEFPCKFFHGYSKCANGSNCKYSHEPLNVETSKLLIELLARDASLKKEAANQEKETPAQSSDATVMEISDDKETDPKWPSLYSSLI